MECSDDSDDDGNGYEDVLTVPLMQVETAFASFLLYGMMLTHYHLHIEVIITIYHHHQHHHQSSVIIINITIYHHNHHHHNDHYLTYHTHTQHDHRHHHHYFSPRHVLLNDLLS